MATLTPGYVFTGPTDPITYAKLNLLGTPSIEVETITVSDLGPQPGTGYLVGSTPASNETTSIRVNDTGLTLHSGVGLSMGSSSGVSSLAIGQTTTAHSLWSWAYNATEASTSFSLRGFFGSSTNATGFTLNASLITSFVNGDSTWSWTAAGSLYNAGATASLATTATDGYFYIPTTSGTPTGVPIATGPGRTAMVFDRAAKKIYCYDDVDDGWISVTLS